MIKNLKKVFSNFLREFVKFNKLLINLNFSYLIYSKTLFIFLFTSSKKSLNLKNK